MRFSEATTARPQLSGSDRHCSYGCIGSSEHRSRHHDRTPRDCHWMASSGFRAWWRWKSRNSGGRPKVDRELRDLIRRMCEENPLWGAPRIHGELLKLGFAVAQSTVSKYTSEDEGHLRKAGKPSCAITRMVSRQ